MAKTKYDFREAADFLNECVPPDELYDDVCAAMRDVSKRRLSQDKRDEIWHTLLCCADFLQTITPKQKGGRDEVA